MALHDFYNCLKTKGEERGFIFITGITKFSQTSIFSALNNLVDLTLKPEYANICGFTIEEFDALFPEHMEITLNKLKAKGSLGPDAKIADLRQKILDWYDGYSWDGKSRVLNPWSILNFFDNLRFNDYWTQTAGAPTYLIDLIKTGKIGFKDFNVEESITDSINVIKLGTEIDPVPLLFQSGYLTVDRVDKSKTLYQYFLDIPNFEVRTGLAPLLLSLKPFKEPVLARETCVNMFNALNNLDKTGFQTSFGNFMGNFGYDIHDTGLLHEAYYHTMFQVAALMASEKVKSEVAVGEGRYDAYYQAPNGTRFVFEIKHVPFTAADYNSLGEAVLLERMEKTAAEAMSQIDSKDYTKPFRGVGQKIYKVAVVVGGRAKVLSVFEKEEKI
jgi:hypothetical protein